MKKVSIVFFVIFLCFGCFFKTNKLIFALDPSEIQLSSNEMGDNRTSNLDIVGEITEEIHTLTLGSTCSGEISYQQPYYFYKYTATTKILTRLKLFRNYVYNRGIACDVYKKLGSFNYYKFLFTYNSSNSDTSNDFPEVPCFPGETFIYRLRDQEGPNVRFSITGYFEEISNTNVLYYNYTTNHLKSLYTPLSEDSYVFNSPIIGRPANDEIDLREEIINADMEPYKNIAKLITPYEIFDINQMQMVGVNSTGHGSAFLLENNVLGTAGHCLISEINGIFSGGLTSVPFSFGKWFSRPRIQLGITSIEEEYILPKYACVTKNYYLEINDNYDLFDYGFLKLDDSILYSSSFALYNNDLIDNRMDYLRSNVYANGYTSGEYIQKERTIGYLCRQNKYTLQGYANVCGGQSGGPVYFKEANTYFVLGNISGYHDNIKKVNYFTTYNSQQINLYNIVTNLD